MAKKINRKCKHCKHCSPPSIIDSTPESILEPKKSTLQSKFVYVGAPKRKIVYRCELGMNHTSIKSQVMLIEEESDFKCSNFSRK